MAHPSTCLGEDTAFASCWRIEHTEFMASREKAYDSSKCFGEVSSTSPILKPEGFQPDSAQAIAEEHGYVLWEACPKAMYCLLQLPLTKSIQNSPLPWGNAQVGIGLVIESNKSFCVLEKGLSKSKLGSKEWIVNSSLKKRNHFATGKEQGCSPEGSNRILLLRASHLDQFRHVLSFHSASTGKDSLVLHLHPVPERRLPWHICSPL